MKTRRTAKDIEETQQAAPRRGDEDAVELASEDSFPASDPPGWNGCLRPGAPYRPAGKSGKV